MAHGYAFRLVIYRAPILSAHKLFRGMFTASVKYNAVFSYLILSSIIFSVVL